MDFDHTIIQFDTFIKKKISITYKSPLLTSDPKRFVISLLFSHKVCTTNKVSLHHKMSNDLD